MMHPDVVGRIVSFIVVSFALLASPAAQPSVSVRWSEDRLSVQASGAGVASVLSEVARHTNIRIQGLEKATGTFDVEFADKPLLQGLRALLEDFNYLIVLGEPFTVWIHSRIASAGSVPGGLERRTSPLDDGAQLPIEDERDQEQEERLEAARELKRRQPRVIASGRAERLDHRCADCGPARAGGAPSSGCRRSGCRRDRRPPTGAARARPCKSSLKSSIPKLSRRSARRFNIPILPCDVPPWNCFSCEVIPIVCPTYASSSTIRTHPCVRARWNS